VADVLTALNGSYEKVTGSFLPVYKSLEFHPASFEVGEHHVEVYAGTDNGTVAKAERPKGPIARQHCHTFIRGGNYQWKICKLPPALPHGAGV